MIVAPCGMKTLAEISHGLAGGLVARAADVVLKERETPLSAIHLDNMRTVTELGAIFGWARCDYTWRSTEPPSRTSRSALSREVPADRPGRGGRAALPGHPVAPAASVTRASPAVGRPPRPTVATR
jgi:hypothetical protein